MAGGLPVSLGFAIVVLSNSQGSIDDIGFHALDESIPLVKQPRTIAVDPRVLDRYVGAYNLAGTKLQITRSRTGLSAEVPDAGSWRLYPETRRRFYLRAIPAQVTFQLNPKGDVTGFELLQEGESVTAKRLGDRTRPA